MFSLITIVIGSVFFIAFAVMIVLAALVIISARHGDGVSNAREGWISNGPSEQED